MKSMTGFGKSKLEINGRVYNIEIKSVNHRYCDVNVRLPRSISCYENEIKKEVSNRVARGKIDVFIDFANYTNEGKNVVLEIEVQGALQVMKKCPDALTIFLVPPSLEELERRIRGRRTESEDIVKERLDKARKEIQTKDEYKYVVENDDVHLAKDKIAKIIKEHQK